MQTRSKRYKKAAEMIPAGKTFTLEEAAELVRKLPVTKFNQTVTLSFHMGVDPKKGDQMVRGTCPLPHGSGKTVRVAVFAIGSAADAAKAPGAELVGYEDLIAKVKEGQMDFDVAIATPAAMNEVRKLGKQLGPRGLMPNPRTGTVTDDTGTAVKAVKAGPERDLASLIATAGGLFSDTPLGLVVVCRQGNLSPTTLQNLLKHELSIFGGRFECGELLLRGAEGVPPAPCGAFAQWQK